MPAPNESLFTQVRDRYFVDPRNPHNTTPDFAEAAALMVIGVSGRDGQTESKGDMQELATTLSREYLYGIDNGQRSPGARYFDHKSVAQLHPAGNMPAILAGLGATIANNNTIIGEVSPLESVWEQTSVDWLMSNVAGFDPEEGSGLLVTGGTLANITALTVARLKLEQQDKKFHNETLSSKLFSWTGLVDKAYTTKQALLLGTSMGHYSLQKAAGLLGPTGAIKFEHVPLEKSGYKMDPKELEKRIKNARRRGIPIMGVVAVAGETETGVVDDLNAIADITEEHGVYLHVDGAYGAPFRLSNAGGLLNGIERADSVTIDPHKYMYTPYAAGAILFKRSTDHALIKGLNAAGASYMFQDEDSRRAQAHEAHQFTRQPYLGDRRIEGSMGGQAAAMTYAVIRTLGTEGLGALLDHNIQMTHEFVDHMAEVAGLEPAHEVELNSICFRPTVDRTSLTETETKALNAKVEDVSERLEEKYKIYLTTTDLPCQDPTLRAKGEKEKVFRAVFTHPYTGSDEVRYIASMLKNEWEANQ